MDSIEELPKRIIKFRAFADFGKFSVMLDEVSIHSSSEMVGLHDEAFKEILEATDWKVNDDYQFEHKTTGEQFGHDTVGVYDSGEEYFFFENTKVMQFTNEHYSDGTEVYEGDIYEYCYEYDSDYDGDMPIVKTSTGKGLVKHISDTWQILEAKREGGTVKAIGNFYQNKELL